MWGAPDGCTLCLRFNKQTAPFDNVALRQAINAAINRDQIVNLAYEGSVAGGAARSRPTTACTPTSTSWTAT